MRHSILYLCMAIVFGLTARLPAQQKEIIGYYPSWKWNSRNNLVSPARIAYDKLTIINYAFFVPLRDGSIGGKDPVGDSLYLRSPQGTSLVDLAHKHHVKVVLSIGGWEDSFNFPLISSTPDLRARFSHSCLAALRRYAFDGIDIDWEFPGSADHNGTSSDKNNFTLLLQSLRDSLNAQGERSGQHYLLTSALPTGLDNLANMDMPSVAGILDMLNIMTYDFYGSWDPVANHNCPLYPSEGGAPSRCVDGAWKLFHETLGIPSSKINLGVPFYGHTYTHCTSLNSPHGGADTVHFSKFGAFYYDISRQLSEFTRYWDEHAMVPYLVSTERQELISYDDPQSVRAKARYAVEHQVRGLIIWEITGDYLDDGSTPLLDAIQDVFHPTNSVH